MNDEPVETDPQAPIFAHFANGADRIDTAGAVVFLKGDEAVKIRRAIRLPFLDYSTLEKRRAAAEAEIALNRENAPSIYRDAAPIRRTAQGFSFDGDGEIVEWATRMRRFDENATLDKLAEHGPLGGATVRNLARAIFEAHARAPVRDAAPALDAMRRWIAQNAEAFAQWPDLFPAERADELADKSREALERATPLLRERGEAGWIRRCHGDLHLGNVAMIEDRPTPFDAIEFDESVATGDVLYDLAFAVMDLWERDLCGDANLLVNAYLSLGPAEHYDALALTPLFLSLRAAIRAKVEAGNLDHLDAAKRERATKAARRYFDFALRFLAPGAPRILAVGGLSGSGKSALAKALAPELGRPPGAVWLRSDVERKRQSGVDETTRLPDSVYSGEAGRRVYAALLDKAARAYRAGAAVVLDATHSDGEERAAATRLAAALHAPFVGLWLDAPLAVRLERVRARETDASDADARVARAQSADPLTEPGWRPLDASGDLKTVLAAARVALRESGGV